MTTLRWSTLMVALMVVGAMALPGARKMDSDHMHPRQSNQPRQHAKAEEQDAAFWNDMAQATLAKHLARPEVLGQAKNVILFLGDGMSIPTLAAARVLQGGEQSRMVFEDSFGHVGLSKTYCVDAMVADSACSATAYLGGVKGNTATLGVTAAVLNRDCTAMRNTSNHVKSILWKAQAAGKATGIVTTTRVTHASPAGGYAHVADRDWETDADVARDGADPAVCDDIAEQLVRGDTGRNLKVILGGGRAYFRPTSAVDEEGQPGRRTDNTDLIAEWRAQKTAQGATVGWAWDRNTLQAIDVANTDYVLGLFETGHMKYHFENDEALKPTLPELTRTAIESLSRDPDGYVLFVEGGRIDHAHHDTRAQVALDETIQFDEAIRAALSITNSADTLIVVTSDHAHTMSFGGYPNRGENLLSIAEFSDIDDKPFSTLAYANGMGYKEPNSDGSRYDITDDNFGDVKYRYPSLAPLSSETHGGDDVAVFASGPWSHLFAGTYEQNFINHAMCYSACLGNGLTACSAGNISGPSAFCVLLMLAVLKKILSFV